MNRDLGGNACISIPGMNRGLGGNACISIPGMNRGLGEYLYVNPRNKSRVLKQRLVNEARLSGEVGLAATGPGGGNSGNRRKVVEPSEGRFTGRFSKAGCLRPVLATSRQARLSGEPPEGRFTGRFFKAGCLRPVLTHPGAEGVMISAVHVSLRVYVARKMERSCPTVASTTTSCGRQNAG